MKTIENKNFNKMFKKVEDELYWQGDGKEKPQSRGRVVTYKSERYYLRLNCYDFGIILHFGRNKQYLEWDHNWRSSKEGCKELFTPEIYVDQRDWDDDHSYKARLQTTSWGSLEEQDIEMMLSGYQHAYGVVKVLNEALPEIIDSWDEVDKEDFKKQNLEAKIKWYEKETESVSNLSVMETITQRNEWNDGDILHCWSPSRVGFYRINRITEKTVDVCPLRAKVLSKDEDGRINFIPGEQCGPTRKVKKQVDEGYRFVKIDGEVFDKYLGGIIFGYNSYPACR